MKATIITNLIILVFCSCKAQQDDGKTFHRNYTIGDIPGKSDFMKLTKQERTADSIFSSSDRTIDSLIRLNDGLKDHALALRQSFVANRGRIYLQAFENGKSKEVDQVFISGMPAPCECALKGDTIFVSMGIGFFGGMVFTTSISGKGFQSSYYEYIDDGRPFKANLTDSFSNSLTVGSKYQYLVLDKAPSFQEGQQLTGYGTMTSANYYEASFRDQLDTNYVSAKVYFTCTVKSRKY